MPGTLPPPPPLPLAPRRRRQRMRWPVALLLLVFVVVSVKANGLPGLGGQIGVHTRTPDLSKVGTYAFLDTQPGSGQPVAYDPCRALHVQLNPAGGPNNSGDLLLQAIGKIKQASGLTIVYDGQTTARPTWDGSNVSPVPGPAPPILVAFADDREVPKLAGDVAGLGGSAEITTDSGLKHYVTGQISLDKDSFAHLHGRPGGDLEARAIMMHELGHVLGLAHVHDSNELMAKRNSGLVAFGPGDLKGLKLLGHGRCF